MHHDFSEARWISAHLCGGADVSAPCPFFRKSFALAKPVQTAELRITALGLYEAEINGKRVGDQRLAPGWTDYRQRVVFQRHDVTGLLKTGDNVLGAVLGDGWYCGHVAWKGRRLYGDRPHLLAALEVLYTDGTREALTSGPDWMYATGPVAESDFLMGEDFDARRELRGWSQPGEIDGTWRPAQLSLLEPEPELVEAVAPPVRVIDEITPLAVTEIPGWLRALRIFDMGQNFSGRIRIRVKAHRGCVIRFRYAEILNPDGTLYTENLRGARSTDYYTCGGDDEEEWEPRFTFHGFRYVEADVAELRAGGTLEVTGLVLHSDMAVTGKFACSNELLNQLQHNITWGQKGNFLDIPTDCPQRDERLGWTGDAQVFIRTASFNMDTRSFFHKWMQDMRDAQGANGSIPATAPVPVGLVGFSDDGGPGWSDAHVICPWTIYLCYGDSKILEDNYPSMKRWIEHIETSRSIGLVRSHPDLPGHLGYGDWLAMDGSGGEQGHTPKDLIGTVFFSHVAGLMKRIAEVLGHQDDFTRFAALEKEVKAVFLDRFVTPAGQLVSSTQTANVLAIHFDMLPGKFQKIAAENLVRDIKARDHHLSTGFLGTPYILHALEKTGHLDVAYRLLEQTTFPSWLFPITNGATTIWERWDGWTPEKGFQNKGMNSFNHYALGAVGDWLYRTVAGLDIREPGYAQIAFRPRPGGSLTHADASIETLHGKAAIRWKKSEDGLHVEMTVPEGASGVFDPPPGFELEPCELPPGTHHRHAVTNR